MPLGHLCQVQTVDLRKSTGMNPRRGIKHLQCASSDQAGIRTRARQCRPVNQIASQPRKGSAQSRVLFPLTGSTSSADTATDGSVYIDQVHRPVSLLRFPEKGGHSVELARYPDVGDYSAQFAVRPDGRAVWKQPITIYNSDYHKLSFPPISHRLHTRALT
jgi:hypothetical protein